MKRSLRLSLVMLVALFFTGCSKNTPKEVAYTWLTSFNHMDLDAAAKLSTPDTRNLLNSLQQLTERVSDSNKKDLTRITISMKEVNVVGDTAAEAFYTSSDDPNKKQSVHLVKTDGKWLVSFSKADVMGGVAPPADELPKEGEAAPLDSAAEVSGDTARH